jgi:predicted  nucleic acid-binding Zn-ribbon protein
MNKRRVEAGDLQLAKAFEETTTKNVKTIQDYTTETRKLVRELEQHVHELKNLVAQRDKDISELRQQLSLVQAKLYAGGTV